MGLTHQKITLVRRNIHQQANKSTFLLQNASVIYLHLQGSDYEENKITVLYDSWRGSQNRLVFKNTFFMRF